MTDDLAVHYSVDLYWLPLGHGDRRAPGAEAPLRAQSGSERGGNANGTMSY